MKLTVEMVRTAVLGLTAALVLGVASVGMSSLSAHAEPKDTSGLACFTSDFEGITGIFFAGEETTLANQNGAETVLRCVGGAAQWEQVSRVVIGLENENTD